MTEKYSDILQRTWSEIPEPKLLPQGSWLLRGKNVAIFPPKEEGKPARVAFFYEAVEPMDDVSQTDLEALGTDYAFSENDIVKQFFINRNKDWDQVRKHLVLHGVDVAPSRSQAETFKDFTGTEIVSYLGTKTFTDGSGNTKTDNDPQSFAVVK